MALWRTLFAARTGSAVLLRRESIVHAEPRGELRNTLARLREPIPPRSGIPRFKERRI
jgi:hypothetical protein